MFFTYPILVYAAAALIGAFYILASYGWMSNLVNRILRFYICQNLELKYQQTYRLGKSYTTLFWLTSLPLLCLPIVCLELGLILERRRRARSMVFCVNRRHELDPELRKTFVTLPVREPNDPFPTMPSYMQFPQTPTLPEHLPERLDNPVDDLKGLKVPQSPPSRQSKNQRRSTRSHYRGTGH